jgi:hypothetical protein
MIVVRDFEHLAPLTVPIIADEVVRFLEELVLEDLGPELEEEV